MEGSGHETKPVQLHNVDDEVYNIRICADGIWEDERSWIVVMGGKERGMKELRGGKVGMKLLNQNIPHI